ncbi:MAG: FecR family protein [Tannerellaceae bacterium]|jgi:ferric-dicitrate binding protein FerR (iron transport regulator)|nr:FecR family protein [Tannerellaceae bacterium]
MDSKYIHALIRKFFENNLPEEIQYKFHNWFVSNESAYEKTEAMLRIWENCPAEQTTETGKELKKIHKQIAACEKRQSISLFKRISRIAAILLLPLISATLTYYFIKDKTIIQEVELTEYFVPYGERKQLFLSDGSEVWLNSGSLLVYAKTFNGNTRTLYLNGEANFNVAKDPEKPFIVKTKSMEVEALGTVFNVLSYPEDEKSITTLESGKVRIMTRHEGLQSIILSPNEQLIYNKTTKKIEKKKVDAEKYARWKEGFLTFQGAAFEEIIKTVERKFGVTVNYEVNRFAGRAFTVKFLPEEEISDVLNILKDIVGFNYKKKGNIIYIN